MGLPENGGNGVPALVFKKHKGKGNTADDAPSLSQASVPDVMNKQNKIDPKTPTAPVTGEDLMGFA